MEAAGIEPASGNGPQSALRVCPFQLISPIERRKGRLSQGNHPVNLVFWPLGGPNLKTSLLILCLSNPADKSRRDTGTKRPERTQRYRWHLK